MKPHEVRRKLKQLGFEKVSNGKKHEIWSNGDRKITVPNGTRWHSQTAKHIITTAKTGGRYRKDANLNKDE